MGPAAAPGISHPPLPIVLRRGYVTGISHRAGGPGLKRGKVIGWVTSCAVDMDGLLTGQAFLDFKNAKVDTPIFIYQSAPKKAGPIPAEMKLGDRGVLPTAAVVVSRFPKL